MFLCSFYSAVVNRWLAARKAFCLTCTLQEAAGMIGKMAISWMMIMQHKMTSILSVYILQGCTEWVCTASCSLILVQRVVLLISPNDFDFATFSVPLVYFKMLPSHFPSTLILFLLFIYLFLYNLPLYMQKVTRFSKWKARTQFLSLYIYTHTFASFRLYHHLHNK